MNIKKCLYPDHEKWCDDMIRLKDIEYKDASLLYSLCSLLNISVIKIIQALDIIDSFLVFYGIVNKDNYRTCAVIMFHRFLYLWYKELEKKDKTGETLIFIEKIRLPLELLIKLMKHFKIEGIAKGINGKEIIIN